MKGRLACCCGDASVAVAGDAGANGVGVIDGYTGSERDDAMAARAIVTGAWMRRGLRLHQGRIAAAMAAKAAANRLRVVEKRA